MLSFIDLTNKGEYIIPAMQLNNIQQVQGRNIQDHHLLILYVKEPSLERRQKIFELCQSFKSNCQHVYRLYTHVFLTVITGIVDTYLATRICHQNQAVYVQYVCLKRDQSHKRCIWIIDRGHILGMYL